MHNRRIVFFAVIIIVVVISGGCTSTAPLPFSPASPATAQPALQQTPSSALFAAFTLRVESLAPAPSLPEVSSCKGASESPAVSWAAIPSGTKSLVLILDDPDAPAGTFTHWIVYNIPPESGGLARAQPNAKVLASGAQQGDTSAGSLGYYPPCPPIGTTHRYIFRLYAVDMDIVQPTADRHSIDRALAGHTIAKTEFTTTFTR